MKSLIKPKKKITQKNSKNYDFNWVSKKVSLEVFLEWCKDIPAGADDVTLELKEDWEYDSCLTYLQLEWKETVKNPNYDKQLKKYKKFLSKLKKK